MANVLALALGLRTGWALVSDNSGKIVAGLIELDEYRDSCLLGDYLCGELSNLKTAFGPFECVRATELSKRRLPSVVLTRAALYWCGTEYTEGLIIPLGDVKKHATGKGNANKAAVYAAAVTRGWCGINDETVTALWLLDYAITQKEKKHGSADNQ